MLTQEQINEMYSVSDVCRHFGWSISGSYLKKARDLVKDLDTSHFVTTGAWKNRKHPIVTKTCPNCGTEFQSASGGKEERMTCSHACANTVFRTGIPRITKPILPQVTEAALKAEVGKGLSIALICEHFQCSKSTIRHWLKKFGLKTSAEIRKGKQPDFQCATCGTTDPEAFYNKRRRTICKECRKTSHAKSGKDTRKWIVDQLGGRCVICGYNKYTAGLDVHHVDPTLKDPNYGHARYWSKKRILEELKGCVLLCGCCHGAFHANQLDKEDLAKLAHYSSSDKEELNHQDDHNQ